MNFLKRIALGLLIVVIIVMIISIFLPSSYHLDRKIVIDADKGQIFKQVGDLKNWKNWSPWALKDPTIYNNNQAFSTPSYGEGARFEWNSENDEVGSGNMEIVISTTNKYYYHFYMDCNPKPHFRRFGLATGFFCLKTNMPFFRKVIFCPEPLF